MIRNFITVVLTIVALLSSCIREDRTHCPCNLHVDLSRVDSDYVHKVDLVMSDVAVGGNPEWYAVDKRYIGDTLIIQVNKSEFDFCAWGNLLSSLLDDRLRQISPVDAPDSLWSCYRRIHTRCEDAYVTVLPERQFIPVTIIVRGMLQGISNIQPALSSISDCLDYNGEATGAREILVPRLISSPENGQGYFLYKTMILTQQSASDATLELQFERNGKTIKGEYPVGEMLLEIGEDITLRDRNPIVLDLTIGAADILLTIKVIDWVTHGVFTITY